MIHLKTEVRKVVFNFNVTLVQHIGEIESLCLRYADEKLDRAIGECNKSCAWMARNEILKLKSTHEESK